MAARLLNRDFFLLWQGQFVSLIGSQAFLLAMMYWTMEATGSASLMGMLMTLSLLPGVVLGPVAGTVADHYSRKIIIVVADILSGLGVLTASAMFFSFPHSTNLLIAALFAVAILNGVVQAFFRPAIMAAVPDLVPRDRIAAANSMNQFSFRFSQILGQGAGGVLYALLGAPVLFLVDGLTFLFSAASESLIHIPQKISSGLKKDSPATAFKTEVIDGLQYVWRRKGMRNFLFMIGAVHFFAMPYIVLMPFYVEINLSRGAEWYGFLMAGFSAGSVAGYAAAGMIPLSGRSRSRALLILMSIVGVIFGFLGFLHEPFSALITIGIGGALLGMFSVHMTTILQTTAGSEVRGRVMGLVMTIANAASPLGMVAGGIAGDLTDKNIPLIYQVCGAGIVFSVILIGRGSAVREYLSSEENDEQGP